MQAGRGLVQNIDRLTGAAAGKLCCEFDPLRLTAGQRRGRLAKLYIAKSDFVQDLQTCSDLFLVLKEFDRFLDRHIKDIGNALALKMHLKRLTVVSLAVADLTRDIDIGQKMHLDLQQSVTGTGFTAAAACIEREPPGGIAAQLCVLRGGKERANIIEQACIGRGIRARRTPDGALVDSDHLVDIFQSLDTVAFAGTCFGAVQLRCEFFI